MEKTRRTLQGIVDKKSSNQSVRVKVEKKQAHPLYGKVVRSHKHYLVHCVDMDSIEVGDVVIIGETKPVSKRKSWEIVSKVEVTRK